MADKMHAQKLSTPDRAYYATLYKQYVHLRPDAAEGVGLPKPESLLEPAQDDLPQPTSHSPQAGPALSSPALATGPYLTRDNITHGPRC